jgi:deoxyinosine 3'endonuclease (endonuclease V)
MDISFVKDTSDAIASLVVMSYPELKVVLELYDHVEMTLPYISGFLAFREVDHLVNLYNRVKRDHENLIPQILMIDGSGIHHHRGFGLACHLGVLCDVPTLGVAKTLLVIDGLTVKLVDDLVESMKSDVEYLQGKSGIIHGAIFKVGDNKNPVFISQGHRISLETTVKLVRATSLFKNPEPVRQADLLSRKFIRDKK